MLSPSARPLTLNRLWLFFILVFCWTWFFWLLAAAWGTSVQTASGKSLLFLGLLGPMLGGIGFTYLAQDKEYQRQYWVAHSGLQTNWSEMVCDHFSFRPRPHGHRRAARCRFLWK
jgi:hypothetical protein